VYSIFGGQLTATLHGTPDDLVAAQPLISVLDKKWTHFGQWLPHRRGGLSRDASWRPYLSDQRRSFTLRGNRGHSPFARPICDQNFPPRSATALRNENSQGILGSSTDVTFATPSSDYVPPRVSSTQRSGHLFAADHGTRTVADDFPSPRIAAVVAER